MKDSRNRLTKILASIPIFEYMEGIDAVIKIEPPKTLKQLGGFIGAVNYYQYMWPHRLHILVPLTEKIDAKNPKFVWNPKMNKSFNWMKALMVTDAISEYPYHNKPFHTYTDYSNH